MYRFRLIAPALLACQLVLTAATSDPAATNTESGGPTVTITLPPVLRTSEPADSRHLVLPGPPRPATPPAAVRKFKTEPPVAIMAALPTRLVEDPILRRPLPRFAVTAPPAPSKPAIPPDAEREIAAWCQKQIGNWKESDARAILGHPKGNRPAYDEHKAVNGIIYAFADPTGHNNDLELDFDRDSGNLRTVFVYPARLTWQECRRLWADPFTSADANKGRVFYSYTKRRLDVLVDAAGKVVSLGWY